MFLRKQTARVGTWSTGLSFHPNSPHSEAGTAVWWNYFTYSSLGIRVSKVDPSKRVLRYRPANGNEVLVGLETKNDEVKLVIRCEGEKYNFGFAEGNLGETQWISDISTEEMTVDPPVGAAFTGMMLGLYAFGELEGCLVPADFKYAVFD